MTGTVREHLADVNSTLHSRAFPQNSIPPKVQNAQWCLALVGIVLALAGLTTSTYLEMRLIVVLEAVVTALMCAVALRNTVRSRLIGQLLMLAGVFVIFLLEGVVCAFQDPAFAVEPTAPLGTSQYDIALIHQAMLYIALFQFMLLVGYSVRPRLSGPCRWISSQIDNDLLRFARYLLPVCLIIPFGIAYGFSPEALIRLLRRPYLYFYDVEAQAAQGYWVHLYNVGLFGVAILLVQATLSSVRNRILPLVVAGTGAVFLAARGTRHVLLFAVLPAIAVRLLQYKRGTVSRRLLTLVVTAAVCLLLFQVQVAFRTRGWAQVGSISPDDVVQGKMAGQFDALLVSLALVPSEHDYFLRPYEPYFALYWVPRAFWPTKPQIPSWEYLNNVWTRGNLYWNITPSIIGQYHMDFGVIGVLAAGFWVGLMTVSVDRLFCALDVTRQHAAIAFVGMLYAFILSSFRYYAPFYAAYCEFAFVMMLCLVMKRKVRHRVR